VPRHTSGMWPAGWRPAGAYGNRSRKRPKVPNGIGSSGPGGDVNGGHEMFSRRKPQPSQPSVREVHNSRPGRPHTQTGRPFHLIGSKCHINLPGIFLGRSALAEKKKKKRQKQRQTKRRENHLSSDTGVDHPRLAAKKTVGVNHGFTYENLPRQPNNPDQMGSSGVPALPKAPKPGCSSGPGQ